jgi:predicted ATP-grasp superfamily ATP-dependent carboligase
LEFGAREPGCVLYPTSDDLAWLLAANAVELGHSFRLYQPSVEVTANCLDKKRLGLACERVGLATVPSWYPDGAEEVAALADRLPYPLLIKPRTQVLRDGQNKGLVVRTRDELLPAYQRYVSNDRYHPGAERDFGDAQKPMLQAYREQAGEGVYSVTGFIDRSFEHWVARGAIKRLQRTRPIGLGVCFEAAPLAADLEGAVVRLCRELGHFGVFEVELLRDGPTWRVIDFNPRFYGQMGFELRRGLKLAYYAWLGALGEETKLTQVLAEAATATDGASRIFCHRTVFELMVRVRGLSGQMSAADRRQLQEWFSKHRGAAVDPSLDATDPIPGLVHTVSELYRGGRSVVRALRRRPRREG